MIKLKKYRLSFYIFNIIINKFYYKKNPYLIILFKINKNLKLSLYCAILYFNFIVYLKIKDSRKFILNIKKII